MSHVLISSNPFALLMDPEAVVAAVERSERLGHLTRRICRPLDKPLIPLNGEAGEDVADDEADAIRVDPLS